MTDNFEKDINVLTKAKLIEQLISKTQECEELKEENQKINKLLDEIGETND